MHMTDTTAATTQGTDPLITSTCALGAANNGRNRTIWYRYVPSTSGNVTADTIGGLIDSILSVFTGTPGAFTEVACNDDVGAIGGPSQVTFAATAGTTYHLMVSSYDTFGGPAVFNLTGPAPGSDFSVSFGATNTITVNRGQSGTATLTVTPNNGAFAGTITFACASLPSQSTCAFNPSSATPGANPTNVTLTVTTTAPGSVPPSAPIGPPLAPWPFVWLAAALALLFAWLRARQRRTRWAHALALSAAVLLAALMVSCGGGSSGPPPPPPNPGTPLGTSTVSVTATSGTVVRSTTFTLTVR
jgi:hypothetical protein